MVDALTEAIAIQVARLREAGAKSIGIFGHSNEGVATLGAALARSGLDHVLIGIPEAHAEALSALTVMCAYAVGLVTSSDVRISLATFLTACTRGNSAPELAVALARGRPLAPGFEAGVKALEDRLLEAASETMADLVNVACEGWKAIRITSGLRPWRRACPEFVALARRTAALPASREHVRTLIAVIERRKPNALFEFDGSQGGVVQLMNFHQTKGREADAVVLVYRAGDYLANRRDGEPFEEASRVLFVSMTRARQEIVVILPSDPHPLIAPFVALGEE